MDAQTNRRHSAYLSTSQDKTQATNFARKEKGYTYEINPMNLFVIDLTSLSAFTSEMEMAVPYSIPFDSVTAIANATGQRLSIEKLKMDGSNAFKRFLQQINAVTVLPAKQQEEAWNKMVDADYDAFEAEADQDFEDDKAEAKAEFKKTAKYGTPVGEKILLEVLEAQKHNLKKLKATSKAGKSKADLKKGALNGAYGKLRREGLYSKLTLNVSLAQQRTANLLNDSELGDKSNKDAQRQAFFDLVADWWFNYYAPQHQHEF